MPYERMMKTLRLENGAGIASNETIAHPAFIEKVTGIDPFERPQEAMVAVTRALSIDWQYSIPRHSVKFAPKERRKDLGDGRFVTEWGFTGSGWSDHAGFDDAEKVYAYDPFDKYGSEEDLRKQIREGISHLMADQELCGNDAIVSGLYYTTLFQWFIVVFGWEMFLVAAASDPERFGLCLDRFERMSRIYAEEYAASEIPFFFCHDDLAMTRGLVFPPEWYRKYLFPAYERILEPVRAAGKKVMFVSDGNYGLLVDDLFAAGVDGIMVDWTFDLKDLFRKYGGKKIIAGNADTMVLTYGDMADVRKEVARCVSAAGGMPGYVIKCSNDLPQNIPLCNIEAYFDAIAEYGERYS